MKEETPICRDCGQSMFEIGGIGKSIRTGRVTDGGFVLAGEREAKLYQCPEDKTVAIY